jgi:hypothetical protein
VGECVFMPGDGKLLPLVPLHILLLDPILWPREGEGQRGTTGGGSMEGGEDPPEAQTPSTDLRKLGTYFSLKVICFPALTSHNTPRTLLGFRTQFSEGF